MVGIDPFKVIGSATSYSRSAWKSIRTSPSSLHGRPSAAAATTFLLLEPLVSYIFSFSRYYSAPSFGMDASASAGRTFFQVHVPLLD